MGHSNVWNSHPKNHGLGSGAWSVEKLTDEVVGSLTWWNLSYGIMVATVCRRLLIYGGEAQSVEGCYSVLISHVVFLSFGSMQGLVFGRIV
ncbi:hypothetical protein I3843_13G060800 [Carya illinoinensis]|nr:hypothetical protein I3843_13G060800 [Carya illinoinensis]